MIDFSCQHCGALLRMDDTFAGRDGWCRECKRMVIVPAQGVAVRIEDLPPGEAIARLQQLLSYAAKKADLYKQHLAEAPRNEAAQRALEAAAREAQNTFVEQNRRIHELEMTLETVRGTLQEKITIMEADASEAAAENAAALAEAQAQVAQLEASLAEAHDGHAAMEDTLAAAGGHLGGFLTSLVLTIQNN